MSEKRPATRASLKQKARYLPNIALFALTCVTVAKAATDLFGPETSWFAPVQLGGRLFSTWPFVLSLMGTLLAHEMGHYLVARFHGVEAGLPIFIPIPFGMGTFGAVIAMPPTNDRNKLVDIGAAGPLAGLIVAIPVLIYGLMHSQIGPRVSGLLEGNSLLYLGIKLLITGKMLPGDGLDVQLHPVAFAGWAGLLVTMVNLMPIGQLDGGHIAYAYFGRRQDITSRWLQRLLLPFAIVVYAYVVVEHVFRGISWIHAILAGLGAAVWIVWWGMLHLLRRFTGGGGHPPVNDGPLTAARRRLCIFMAVLFILLFMPIPLRRYLTRSV